MAKPLRIKNISPVDSVEKGAVRILRRRIKEFYSHWPSPDIQPTLEQLHNLRISGKRLRYSAESLRDFYPDRLALLIDLLKRNQDLLGDLQDCVTQRAMIEIDLDRLRRRRPDSDQVAALEKICAEYEERQSTLFSQFSEIWRGMTIKEFRASLKAMISTSAVSSMEIQVSDGTIEAALHLVSAGELLPIDQAGDEPGAETVVDIDHRDV
jgi:hypothetical protein